MASRARYAPLVRAFDDVLTQEAIPQAQRRMPQRAAWGVAALMPSLPCHAVPCRALLQDDLPPLVARHVLPEAVVLEFAPQSAEGAEGAEGGGLFPVAWFAFRAGSGPNETGLLQCELARPRGMRYVVLKLIRPEDRMGEMGDDHAQPNVDLEFCGLRGHVI